MADGKTKHTFYLREGDMDYIISATPQGKASLFIRRIISNTVDRMRAKEQDLDLPPDDITL